MVKKKYMYFFQSLDFIYIFMNVYVYKIEAVLANWVFSVVLNYYYLGAKKVGKVV